MQCSAVIAPPLFGSYSVAVNRVATLKQLDSDLHKHAGLFTLVGWAVGLGVEKLVVVDDLIASEHGHMKALYSWPYCNIARFLSGWRY